MVVAMHCVVARIAPRVARARITPSSVPTARVPTEKGFTGVGGRVAGAARALSWTAAPHQASSRTAILRARVSHRAHPRAALASPLTRASAEGPAAGAAASISSSANVCYGKPAPGVNVTHQLITFFRFTELKDPDAEVEAHHAYVAEHNLQIRGRIYINEQGINAQMSGKGVDGETYARWVESRPGFKGMRISVYPTDAHGHPKLSLRYKPQLVQLEGGTAHLPLHDPSARATPLKPNEWHDMLGEVIAETDDAPVLLDVRNGYEWDVGHFKGASRPVQESFRETVETNVDDCVSGPLSGVDKKKPIMMYCTGGIRCDVYSTVLKQQGYDNVFTLEGGVQAYFDEYGDREDQRWDDHLFVFDSRLAMTPKGLPASEAGAEAATLECHCCKERSAPPPHRNCPNVDCNRLFLVCPACVSKLGGFCCGECGKASHVRPALLQPGRYQRYVHYTEGEAMSRATRRGPGRQQRRERRRARRRLEAAKITARAVARGETPRDLIRAVRVLEKAAENPDVYGGPANEASIGEGTGTLAARTRSIIKAAGLDEESVGGFDSSAESFIEEGGGDDRYVVARARLREAAEAIAAGGVPGVNLRDLIGEAAGEKEEAESEA